MTTVAEVRLWGSTIGAASLEPGHDVAAFQYDPRFTSSGIEVSPITMLLSSRVFTFPTLPRATFHGLPGLLADTLPDRFGNALIDTWLARQGRAPDSFSALERLCYMGTRGMGALEYSPTLGPTSGPSQRVDIDALGARSDRLAPTPRQDTTTGPQGDAVRRPERTLDLG